VSLNAQSTTPAVAPAPDAAEQLTTVKTYCATCHNDRVKTGGVSFDGLTADTIGQHADVFEKAVRKVRGRVMPSPNARQPSGQASDALVAWLEQTLDKAETRQHVPDK